MSRPPRGKTVGVAGRLQEYLAAVLRAGDNRLDPRRLARKAQGRYDRLRENARKRLEAEIAAVGLPDQRR